MATITESSGSTTEVTSNSKKQIVTDQSYVFKVHTGVLPEKQFVCVTGSLWELGEWVVEKSLKLNKKDNGVWEFPISIPHLMEINYRYLVCSELKWRGEKKLIVEQFESTVHPRKFVSSTAVKGSSPVVVEDGEFGTTRRGEHSIDEGWLQHVSELQLHLHSSTEQGIRLDTQPNDHCYKIKMKQSNYCDKTMDICEHPLITQMRARILDVSSGGYTEEEMTEDGVLYDTETMMTLTARSPDFSNCAFIVDIFSSKDDQFLGRSSILPQHLKDDAGRLILTVFNKEMLPVGVIQFDFIVVHPIDHFHIHSLSKVYCSYWNRKRRALDIGHRGLGDSFDLTRPEELRPTKTENTIESLEEAGANGADFVEFDVQLTADLVPVVFHDFVVCTTFARKGLETGKLVPVKVKDLTLKQLQSLRLAHSNAIDGRVVDSDGSSDISDLDNEFTLHKEAEEDTPEKRTFPLLVDLLKRLPKSLGFNIELKYPSPRLDGLEDFPYFDRNLMADIVMKTVFKYGRDRRIILSCFDPDMCTMLRLKQPRFPVLLLARTEAYKQQGKNIRTRTLNAGISFVKSQKLLGIVAYSDLFLEKKELIKTVTEQGLVLLTWGEKNNISENISLQKKLGVDGIIYDGISRFTPSSRDDVMKKEMEKITQSVQAHHPRLIAQVLEEDDEQDGVSPRLPSQSSMTAIIEAQEPAED